MSASRSGPGAAPAGVEPIIREASRADCAAIAAIYNEAIRSGRATMDTEPVAAASFERKLGELSSREVLLVAQSSGSGSGSGAVVGWAHVKRYSERPGYAIACETSIYLAEAEQGRGIGSLLLGALVSRAEALGYRHLVARIMGVNESSIRFHERHGFETVGRQRRIGIVDGILHDVVIMQRLLPEEPPEGES